MAEALEASVSLGVGGPASLTEINSKEDHRWLTCRPAQCQTWVSPGAADDAEKAAGRRRVIGSHQSPGRKSSPPRMAARVRGVAALWSRLQPVTNVDTDMTTVNSAKSVANTRPRYASGTLSCNSVELKAQRTFAAIVARHRAAAASHSVGI